MVVKSDELITVREAARIVGRTSETVRRWIWDGKLPAQKMGNQLFVKRIDLLLLPSAAKEPDPAGRLAALEELADIRERIAQHIGGTLDVLAILDESREAHP